MHECLLLYSYEVGHKKIKRKKLYLQESAVLICFSETLNECLLSTLFFEKCNC